MCICRVLDRICVLALMVLVGLFGVYVTRVLVTNLRASEKRATTGLQLINTTVQDYN